jgi:hypothetical protein
VKLVRRIILCVVGLAALVYAGDYARVRVPIPRGYKRFDTVIVRPYYDVGLKSGKSDLYFLDPQARTCVNSLFPHMGYTPCWYVRRHTHPRIAM